MPWIFCEETGFIESDVLRWTESVFEERGRKRRLVRVGRLRVTAQFLEADGDYIRLLVASVEVLEDISGGRKASKVKPREEIRRKRSTIEKGRPERRLWSDETARMKVVRELRRSVRVRRRRSKPRKAFAAASGKDMRT